MRKLVAVVAGVVLALSACASEEAVPKPTSGQETHEIVSDETYNKIASEAASGIAAANESVDSANLGPRVGGPARTYRDAQLKMKSLLGDAYELEPMLVETEASPISSGTAFPRTMMTSVPPRDGKNLSTLSVWNQDEPRSNYYLWADVSLFPGVKVPDLVNQRSDTAGFPEVDAQDYAVDPAQVMSQYALYNGTREQQAIAFSPDDPLHTQIADQQDAFVESLGDLGTAATNFAVGDAGVRGVSTANGGLVIVGELTYQVDITKTAPDANLRIGGQIGALHAGDGDNAMLEIDHKGLATYGTMVAFYIPPTGQDPVVAVIGASEPTLISVENVPAEQQEDAEPAAEE